MVNIQPETEVRGSLQIYPRAKDEGYIVANYRRLRSRSVCSPWYSFLNMILHTCALVRIAAVYIIKNSHWR